MKRLLPFLILVPFVFMMACSSPEKEENQTDEQIEETAAAEAKKDFITGYATLQELSEEVVYSIKENDYEDYIRHVMTKQMEETVSKEIKVEANRDHFLGEFGFSLDREKEEFENLVEYFKERDANFDSINYKDVEIVDYHSDDYAPLVLKEVIITVPHEYDLLLIYIAIKIKDRWYLTSELEV